MDHSSAMPTLNTSPGPPLNLYLSTILACALISLTSMASLLIFTRFVLRPQRSSKISYYHEDPSKSEVLKLVLSFAVGGLLGDVFLHILPEASVELRKLGYGTAHAQHYLGVWVLVGLILFATAESVSKSLVDNQEEDEEVECSKPEVRLVSNGSATLTNGSVKQRKGLAVANGETKNGAIPPTGCSMQSASTRVSATGYLNLLANGFDNLTHGMSVGASFLVSTKMGVLTSAAIAIHEMPHEIADYVILLRSGFSCWHAFRAQLSISAVTMLGAVAVLYCDHGPLEGYTLWILPLTAGGFIYIALTSLLPELLEPDGYPPKRTENANSNQNEAYAKTKHRSANLLHFKRLLPRIAMLLLGVFTMQAVHAIDF